MLEEGGRHRANLRILLVEDDPDHAELVLRGFEEQERTVDVDVVCDGEAALAHLEALDAASLPHLVLLDLRLPRMDGLQLLREVKSRRQLRALPCVVLTTSDADRDMVRAYELHANSYLVKPGNREGFARLMGEVEQYWLGTNRRPRPDSSRLVSEDR
jgi:DNA-binding response OmpR family regulator